MIGYSGLGGRELFCLDSDSTYYSEVAYGDWVGFVDCVHHYIEDIQSNPSSVFKSLLRGVEKVKSHYCLEKMNQSVFSVSLLKYKNCRFLYCKSGDFVQLKFYAPHSF